MFDFIQYFSNYENVYHATILIFCIGIVISSIEYLVIRSEFKEDGVFSWKIFSSRPNYLNSRFRLSKFRFIFGYKGFVSIHICRIICCCILPFIDDYFLKAILISFIAISSLIFSFRNIVGNDGSDQMNSVICISLFLAFLIHDSFTLKLCLIFIAMQSILSYVISGIAKIVSVKWRSGVAIFQIMNSKSYGHQTVAVYLNKAPKLINYILCWQIILFETLFFLVLFLPSPWLLIFLIWGIVFHIYNAITMGLNNFLWAFVATYPSLIFLSQLITSQIYFKQLMP